jgi:CBS domain-containing protein
MTTDVFTLRRNDRLSIADDLMRQRRIRHIPVLDEDGRLAGIVSQRDLFRSAILRTLGFGSRAEDQVLNSLVVKEAMTTQVETIGPDAPIREAAERMCGRKIGCLPVVEDGKLVGILTEGDFVALVARSG